MDRIAVAVAIGSNLGDRHAHLEFARRRLKEIVSNLRESKVRETAPEGVSTPQGHFLNQVVVGACDLSARELLERLLVIERERGRTRPFRTAPRTLDLDLILAGDLVIAESGLHVPHPRFRKRLFVLEPLAEIAPEIRDPVTGKTARQLLTLLRRARAGPLR
jgi:2-amino-4-hydroxy-6-hydroxymethyldihydropteridine diphosphokinase